MLWTFAWVLKKVLYLLHSMLFLLVITICWCTCDPCEWTLSSPALRINLNVCLHFTQQGSLIYDCSQGCESVPIRCSTRGRTLEAPCWDFLLYAYVRNPILHHSLSREVLRAFVSTELGCTCRGSCTYGRKGCHYCSVSTGCAYTADEMLQARYVNQVRILQFDGLIACFLSGLEFGPRSLSKQSGPTKDLL